MQNLQKETLNTKPLNTGVYLHIKSNSTYPNECDFTAILTSMYQSLAKKQGWKCKVLHISKGTEGGSISSLLYIENQEAFTLLKIENGFHKLLRISPFTSGNKRKSAISRVEVFQSSNVNSIKEFNNTNIVTKIGSKGVNIADNIFNLSFTCSSETTFERNLNQAKRVLFSKMSSNQGQIKYQDYSPGQEIRSYTLHPYKQVKDHRSGMENNNPEEFFTSKGLLNMIQSVKL